MNMDTQIIKLATMITSMLLIGCSAVVLHMCYRAYYKRMKSHHPDEWRMLMNRDPVVQVAGEWIRWPSGSIYLLKSVLSIREYYHDNVIKVYKKRALISFVIFAVSFVLFIIASALLRWLVV